ncbi:MULTISPECIES: phosphatase PAP2 family protein [unclassified Oceanobacillus]|uniref:phosphatase PAP2 family protein n=1 Tax=unclassified Oceanobacillus TaxID=2630292 RepID=UPI001BEB50AA|nr:MULTISPECIES: phosphatase PAP2 family protein [unclassified Oceanobacillus]MBT2599140.1 phosphatase PAP2 family protein [Oceanobacillus sp. ISL-74]MBT2652058.1 phosphatase PAP2 family protein [Oceanobacillus sp. ISL-73]
MRNKKIGIIFLTILLVIIGIWSIQVTIGIVPLTDRPTREFVDKLSNTTISDLFRNITELGSSTFLIPFVIVIAIVLLLLYKHWFPALLFVSSIVLTHVLNVAIKMATTRERPSISVEANAEGYSFPSGHSMIPMVCYGLVAYFIGKKLPSSTAKIAFQSACGLLVLLIGISRYVINVHYLTDVIAGFTLGFILLMGSVYIHKKFEHSPTRDVEKSNP